jgi:hypothetical protein
MRQLNPPTSWPFEAASRLCSCVSCRTWPCLAAFFRSDYLWQSAGCWPRYVPDKEKDEDGKNRQDHLDPISTCVVLHSIRLAPSNKASGEPRHFAVKSAKWSSVCFALQFSRLVPVDAVQLAGGNVSEGIFVGAFMSMSSTAVVSCPPLYSSLICAQTLLIGRPRQTVYQPSASVRLQRKL